jgi:hypothetical protein
LAVRLKIQNCSPKRTAALGATLAEEHMQPVVEQIVHGILQPGSMVILDFDGVSSTNGSYVRATALWLLKCGQLFAKGERSVPRHPADPRPYDVFVCVTGLCEDLVTEFREFFEPRDTPVLYARKLKDEQLVSGSLIGTLDSALRLTLQALTSRPNSTAPELHTAYPDENITPTAWNNRLNDLWTLRLATRNRCGRAWQYQPLAKEITWA